MSAENQHQDWVGNRVAAELGGRFDLSDFFGLPSSFYRQISQAMGGLMGGNPGCLSGPIVTYRKHPASGELEMSLSPFQFYYCWPESRHTGGNLLGENRDIANFIGQQFEDGKQKAHRGMIFTHDPEAEGQEQWFNIESVINLIQSRWDNTEFRYTTTNPDQIYPYLWVRPVMRDVAQENRKKWNPLTRREITFTTTTRRATRFEFKVAFDRPSIVSGEPFWQKIGQFLGCHPDGNAPGTEATLPQYPVLHPISVWDDEKMFEFTREPGTAAFAGDPMLFVSGNDTGTEPQYGLPPFDQKWTGEGLYEADATPLPTVGVSAFLSPRPPQIIGPDNGMIERTHERLNYGISLPENMGLVSTMHMVRSRIQGLGSRSESGGNNLKAWYELPKYSLEVLGAKFEALLGRADTADTERQEMQQDIAATNALARRVARSIRIPYNTSTNTWDWPDNAPVRITGGDSPGPYESTSVSGKVAVDLTFTNPVDLTSVLVNPIPNTDGNYGCRTLDYIPAGGGYRVEVVGVWPRDNDKREWHVNLEMKAVGNVPDLPSEGNPVGIFGGFSLVAFAE